MKSNHLKFTPKIIILGIFSLQMIWAYPGFGKKINPEMSESCSQCHVAFPKLRLYGRTIREIGYNVPKTESEDEGLIKSIYRSIPIGIRGKLDIADTHNGKSMLSLVQLLSSGTVLNNKLAWWYHKHLYDIEDDKDSKLFDPDKFIPINEGEIHEVWLQYNHSTGLNVRAGMYELPFWFSPVKTKVGESDYLVYGATGNPDMSGTLAAPQFGIALNGYLSKGKSEDDWGDESEDNYAEGYNYAITVTNGKSEIPQGSDINLNTFYGRITKKEYSYAAGLWALTGMAEFMPEDEHDDHAMKTMEMDDNMDSKRYYRLGADIDLFLKGDDVNLYGSFIYGNDIDRDFVGGLIGYDHLILPKLFGLVRLDGVFFLNGDVMEDDDPHDEDGGDDHGEEEEGGHDAGHVTVIMDDASSFSAGIYYLPFTNIRVGFEYVYQLNGDIGKDIHGKGGKGIFQIQFGF